MDDLTARIAQAVERGRDPAIALLQGLVRAGREGEPAVQARIAATGRAAGLAVEEVRYRPADVPMREEFASPSAIDGAEQLAILATSRGRGGGRSLVLFAHPDGEPLAGTEGWRHDAFAGAIDGGRLYGWGVADDLAGVAIMFAALAALREAGLEPLGDVHLCSTPSKRHRRGIAALLSRGLTADAALYLHPAESGFGLADVKAFSSGQVEFVIAVAGVKPDTNEPIQSTFAHRAVSPIDKALIVRDALLAMNERRAASVRHPALDGSLGRATDLLLSFMACGRPDSLYRAPTECRIGGALSFPPSETVEGVKAEIARAVTEAAASDPWLAAHPPTIEWVSGMPGAEVPVSHPLFAIAADAVEAVTGARPRMNALHTTSDIRNSLVQAGIATVGLGPLCGDLAQNGHRDEWVDVEDYLRAVAVVAGIVARWCGAAEAG